MNLIVRDTKLIIFDLDNCLYREPQELRALCEQAMARAASEHIEGLGYEQALVLACEGNAVKNSVYARFLEEFEFDLRALHETYHDYVDHTVLQTCRETRSALQILQNSGLILALLTHGSTGWAQRVLQRLDLQDIFDPALTVSIEQVGFRHKYDGPEAFTYVMDRAARYTGRTFVPAETIMVDDRDKNLIHPHAMGLTTVLVTHGCPAEDFAHVGIKIDTVADLALPRFSSVL